MEQLIFALMLTSTYTLISVGFALFFGAIKIVHFSHGDVAMLGAFFGIILYGVFGLTGVFGAIPSWVVTPIVFVVTCLLIGFLGTFFERTVIKPFRKSPLLMVLVATIALGIVIREAIRLFYPQGSNPPCIPCTSSPDDLRHRSLSVAIGSYAHLSDQRSVNCRHVCFN